MSDAPPVRLTFFGGVGEIGKNMSVFECDGSILVVDVGAQFPENDMLGVDLVIPDYTYLEENQDRIAAVVLTHGHEDHVGGLPFFLERVTPPKIYGTRLTLGMVEAKLGEYSSLDVPSLVEVSAGDVLEEGPFRVELIHVNHSIPDAVALAISTPVGAIIHTADFKFDQTPIDEAALDSGAFARYGDEGVRLLICDSTNAERHGYVETARAVGEALGRIMERAQGRVIITTFASNVHRVQQVFDYSRRVGRKVVVDGRSMIRFADVAQRLGYLHYHPQDRIQADEMEDYDANQITIVTTGSQGEPTSALTRMSVGEHRKIAIEEGDTVVLSATPIPGNEALIWRTVNNLFRQGATVIYPPHELVHVSGHGNSEEIKLMLSLTKPQHVVPYHGEARHQHKFGILAVDAGIPAENVHMMLPYDVLEITESGAAIVDRLPGEALLVDGEGVGDVGAAVLRERRILSEDGVVFVSAVIDADTREIIDGPAIETRGFIYIDESEELMDAALDTVVATIADAGSDSEGYDLEREVKGALTRLFRQRTGRRPQVIPVIFELEAAEGDSEEATQ